MTPLPTPQEPQYIITEKVLNRIVAALRDLHLYEDAEYVIRSAKPHNTPAMQAQREDKTVFFFGIPLILSKDLMNKAMQLEKAIREHDEQIREQAKAEERNWIASLLDPLINDARMVDLDGPCGDESDEMIPVSDIRNIIESLRSTPTSTNTGREDPK